MPQWLIYVLLTICGLSNAWNAVDTKLAHWRRFMNLIALVVLATTASRLIP
jgi:hypothetical protein